MSVILNSTHAIVPHVICDTLLCVPFSSFLSVLVLTEEALQHMLRLPLRLAFVEDQLPSAMELDSRAGGQIGRVSHLKASGDTASPVLNSLVIKAPQCIDPLQALQGH